MKKSFFEDLKLVGITILSLFIPKRMGHYLIIRLLKIEDNGEFKLRDTIDDVKIKKTIIKKNTEPTKRNLRMLLFADLTIELIINSLLILWENPLTVANLKVMALIL